MSYPTEIVTPRLILSRYEKSDAGDLHVAKQETWESLTDTFFWASYGLDYKADQRYVEKCHNDFNAGLDFNFVARDRQTGDAVSFSGVHPVPGDQEYQFGLWVTKSAQGQGYAPEIVNGLIRYAFEALEAKKIVGCHIPSNEGSKKLFNKIGMVYEETRPLSLVIGGGLKSDAHWYKMDAADQLPEMDVHFNS